MTNLSEKGQYHVFRVHLIFSEETFPRALYIPWFLELLPEVKRFWVVKYIRRAKSLPHIIVIVATFLSHIHLGQVEVILETGEKVEPRYP